MKNFLKLFSFFCIISFSFNCQPEMASENDANLTTDLRSSECECQTEPDPYLMPELINLDDGCSEGQCCFDLRFSFAYQTPSMQITIPTLLTPDVGWPIFVSIEVNGLAHYCIDCDATCFTLTVLNWISTPPRYDCYEFDSPCN